MAVVVDTNVPVVANGKAPQASQGCVLACIERIEQVIASAKRLVLDNEYLIISEYSDNLRSDGEPGIGDSFLKWVLTNRANPNRCDVVSIAKHPFPGDSKLAGFDPSDQKFVRTALAHTGHPAILQAVDSKWWGYKEALAANGVTIEFICEADVLRLLR